VTDEGKAGESAGLFIDPSSSHFLPEDTNRSLQFDQEETLLKSLKA
jgi:hypothetical protein